MFTILLFRVKSSFRMTGRPPGISWAKRGELGEATARLMADYARESEKFPFINKLVLLSGPRAFSLSEAAKVSSTLANLRAEEQGRNGRAPT